MKSAVPSLRCKAIDLGTSSPRTIWNSVIRKKLMAIAALWASSVAAMPPENANSGSMRCAREGSPIQPNARLARVIPSCVAAI